RGRGQLHQHPQEVAGARRRRGPRSEPPTARSSVSERRVVVTGTGLITALGTGGEKSWQGMLAGKPGVRRISKFDPALTEVKIAGEVTDFNAEDFIERREVRRMDLFTQYALAAAEMAVKESGIQIGDGPNAYRPERVGALVGSGIGGLGSLEEQHKRALEKGF